MKRCTILAVLLGFFAVALPIARPARGEQPKEQQAGEAAVLAQMQKERIETLEKLVGMVMKKYQIGLAQFSDVAKVQEELIEAKLESTTAPDERIALLTEQMKAAQEVFDIVEKQYKVGFRVSDVDLHQTKAHLQTIEIKLFKEKKNADSAKLEQLQKERIDVYDILVVKMMNMYMKGAGPYHDYAPFALAQEEIIGAILDGTEKSAERIALLEKQLKLAQECYDYVDKARTSGFGVTDIDFHQAKAQRLAIEIKLLEEKNSGDPAKLEQLRKERSEDLEKLVKLLIKQYETAPAGAKYAQAPYRTIRELAAAKLAVANTPAERIAALEEQLKTSQDLQDYTKKQVEVGFQRGEDALLPAKALCLTIKIMLAKERMKAKPAG
jgi:hypothetical protein